MGSGARHANVATLIAVYGVFMTPLGWGWALFVWGYALAWFLVNDCVKLLAYRIFYAGQKLGSTSGVSSAGRDARSRRRRMRCRPCRMRRLEVVPAPGPAESTSPARSAGEAIFSLSNGLTSEESRRRLKKFGPNVMPDTTLHPLRMAIEKFWAPVPWMLKAAIVLELVLSKYIEAAIIAGLLVFNAALGLFQESRAQATLTALKSRLALNAVTKPATSSR